MVCFGNIVIPSDQLLVADLPQVIDVLLAFRWPEDGVEFAFLKLDIDAVCDFLRPLDSVFVIRKRRIHLAGRANI